jgi:hypothetical protein
MKRIRKSLVLAASGFFAGVSLCAIGCDDRNSVQVYQAPKESAAPVAATAMGAPDAPAISAAMPAAGDGPQYVVPNGWKQLPAQQMRYATFQIDPADPKLNVIVYTFGPESGALLPNVNRWEQQIGAPVSDASSVGKVVTHLQNNGLEIDCVDLKGPPPAGQTEGIHLLAAIIPGGNAVWFLKFEGPESKVAAHRAEYDAFLKSFSLPTAPAVMPAQATAVPQTPAAVAPAADPHAGLSMIPAFKAYTLPNGWTIDPQQHPMRVATIHAGPADLIISALPANGFGSAEANLTRWRGQVGLEPVTDASTVAHSAITVGGSDGLLYDFAGTQSELVVAQVTHGSDTYFFKLIGPMASVVSQKKEFDAFLQSIQFAN